jgi:hypothetical protein
MGVTGHAVWRSNYFAKYVKTRRFFCSLDRLTWNTIRLSLYRTQSYFLPLNHYVSKYVLRNCRYTNMCGDTTHNSILCYHYAIAMPTLYYDT